MNAKATIARNKHAPRRPPTIGPVDECFSEDKSWLATVVGREPGVEETFVGTDGVAGEVTGPGIDAVVEEDKTIRNVILCGSHGRA